MVQTPHHRLYQLQTRHLLGIVTAAGVLFAILAPRIGRLEQAERTAAWLKTLFAVGLALATLGYAMYLRRKCENIAGPVSQRFDSASSQFWTWVLAGLMWLAYLAGCWAQVAQPGKPNVLPGSPILLYIAVNYSVVRIWWRIHPGCIEIGERGLLLAGLQAVPWNMINRHSFSGTPPRQLNLFLKSYTVLNVHIDTRHIAEFEEILAQRVPRAAAVATDDGA